MREWQEQYISHIERLENMDQVLKEILTLDKTGNVIGYDERAKIKVLQNNNQRILNKFKNQDFIVAIVGLDKGGKSTLGNAIIKHTMLPESAELCTCSVTEIRAGQADCAEVFFYSLEEFQAIFKVMLSAIGFRGYADFLSLDCKDFDKFWNDMEEKDPGIYRLHDGTTVEDIRRILACKETIKSLLGKEPLRFSTDASDDLAVYITGIDGVKDGCVRRTGHPFAVKKVTVKSTELKDMEHMVLFDVPGFDSPSVFHKSQLKAMLKHADVIILVTDAGIQPNLRGTQLDLFRKVVDADGIRLCEKTFVFGNKLDKANNRQGALENESILRRDVVRYGLASNEHVVCGSARAYLEKIGVSNYNDKYSDHITAQNILQDWGIEDGVEKLKNLLKDYYGNCRYDVLRHRAEKAIASTEQYLNEIVDKYSPEMLNKLDRAGEKHVLQVGFALPKFNVRAYEIVSEHITQIEEDRPFSRLIEENIETIFPFMSENSEELRHVELEGKTFGHTNYNSERVNLLLREKLKVEFFERLVKQTTERTQEEQRNIRQELVENFLSVLGMREGCTYRDELIDSVNILFDQLLLEEGEKCYSSLLIEHYTSSLIEAVIRRPFGGVGRFNCVSNPKAINEIATMAVYYNDGDEFDIKNVSARMRRILANILTHAEADDFGKNDDSEEISLDENLSLPVFLEKMKKIGEAKGLDSIIDRNTLLKTLNTDIMLLRDIVKNAVIFEMNLEGHFLSIIMKNVELIRSGVVNETELMTEWLSQNVRKIMESEYASIINEQANNQTRKMIMKSIQKVL